MLGLNAVLAHLGHNVGHHLELIAHKGIAVRKVFATGVADQVATRAIEGKYIFEYGALGFVALLKLSHARVVL